MSALAWHPSKPMNSIYPAFLHALAQLHASRPTLTCFLSSVPGPTISVAIRSVPATSVHLLHIPLPRRCQHAQGLNMSTGTHSRGICKGTDPPLPSNLCRTAANSLGVPTMSSPSIWSRGSNSMITCLLTHALKKARFTSATCIVFNPFYHC